LKIRFSEIQSKCEEVLKNIEATNTQIFSTFSKVQQSEDFSERVDKAMRDLREVHFGNRIKDIEKTVGGHCLDLFRYFGILKF
jgi:hypothetical protein